MAKTTRAQYQRARHLVNLFYDFQKGRIAYELRVKDGNDAIELNPDDIDDLAAIDGQLGKLERLVLKQANKVLEHNPVYQWLISQRGISGTLAPVLLGSVDIHKTPTPSAFCRIAGLAVDSRTGKRECRVKGEKCHFNPHLKSRMFLLGECLIRANNEHYRKFYDNYKHRKQNTLGPCMACDSVGTIKGKGETKAKPCTNCNGTGHGPWGKSDKHRHIAAMRYMVKMLIIDLWVRWREYEELPIRRPYAEEYLGRTHHTQDS